MQSIAFCCEPLGRPLVAAFLALGIFTSDSLPTESSSVSHERGAAFDRQALTPSLVFVRNFPWRWKDVRRVVRHRFDRSPLNDETASGLLLRRVIARPYPDSQLPGSRSLPPSEAFLIVLGTCKLKVRPWPALDGTPFTKEERRQLDNPDAVLAAAPDVHPYDVVRYKQTGYDRSTGVIKAKAVLVIREGWLGLRRKTQFLNLSGTSSSNLDRTKRLIPPYQDLVTNQTAVQLSMGNFVDHYGFFIMEGGQRWRYVGPVDEPWKDRHYHVLVEYTDGSRQLGNITLVGNAEKNTFERVHFTPINGAPRDLRPQTVAFVLSTYAFGWGEDEETEESEAVQGQVMASNYDQTSDLRHLFAFPYINGDILFYDQVAASAERVEAAKHDTPLTLALKMREGTPLSAEVVRKLLKPLGYHEMDRFEDVKKRGDFIIGRDTVRIILRSARYPLNAIAVGRDGQVALVYIGGASGRVGANYWTVFSWASKQVADHFGWHPFTLLALDNGMDPTWGIYSNRKLIWRPAESGRPRANGSLLVEPAARKRIRRQAAQLARSA
jgi:hypothetical protein